MAVPAAVICHCWVQIDPAGKSVALQGPKKADDPTYVQSGLRRRLRPQRGDHVCCRLLVSVEYESMRSNGMIRNNQEREFTHHVLRLLVVSLNNERSPFSTNESHLHERSICGCALYGLRFWWATEGHRSQRCSFPPQDYHSTI